MHRTFTIIIEITVTESARRPGHQFLLAKPQAYLCRVPIDQHPGHHEIRLVPGGMLRALAERGACPVHGRSAVEPTTKRQGELSTILVEVIGLRLLTVYYLFFLDIRFLSVQRLYGRFSVRLCHVLLSGRIRKHIHS